MFLIALTAQVLASFDRARVAGWRGRPKLSRLPQSLVNQRMYGVVCAWQPWSALMPWISRSERRH